MCQIQASFPCPTPILAFPDQKSCRSAPSNIIFFCRLLPIFALFAPFPPHFSAFWHFSSLVSRILLIKSTTQQVERTRNGAQRKRGKKASREREQAGEGGWRKVSRREARRKASEEKKERGGAGRGGAGRGRAGKFAHERSEH